MSNPKVSVIIPVYNVEKYLRQCLDSIINQTLKEIEIICVDDGSTDSSLEILKEYEQNDKRVKVIKQKNQFAGVARNNGLKVATGDWVTFIDSDDFCELTGLENMYKIAEENDLDFIKCSSRCYNESLQQYENIDWYINKKAENLFDKVISFNEYPDILYAICDTPWSGLYRMSFVKENNIYFPNFRCVNDRSFFVNCLLKAQRLLVTNIYFVNHRIERAGSLITSKHYHFDDQIRHYNRIKEITKEINNGTYTQFALKRELFSLFYWYEMLIDRKINRLNIQNLMIEFCNNFDENDVSIEYLKTFKFANLFEELRNRQPLSLYDREVENPKISVIIPVFNTIKYLPICIESVLKQTLTEIEIICIDDCSNDGSYELLLEYAAIDKRIKVAQNEGKGVAHARYHGCCMAKASYVQFLDSDDWLTDKALETVYEQQLLNDYDICSFKYYNYDENEKKVLNITSGIEEEFLPCKKIFNYTACKEKIFQLVAPNVWSKTYRREFILPFLKLVVGFNGPEDMIISCYSSLFAEKMMFIKEPLYYYRRNRLNSLETSKDLYPLKFYGGYKLFHKLITEHSDSPNLQISYVNRALRGCIYDLLSKKTEAGYYNTYKFLKEEGFKELNILGHPKTYYYDQMDCSILKYISNYEYIFSRMDLLLLSDIKVDRKKKEDILNKYQFKYKLEHVSKCVPTEVIFDKRNIDFKPDISVIVPVYNTALYLRSCLDSLKEQSLQNIEIICVNDGSTDDSLHILQRYVNDDYRFVIISQDNAGQSVARNTGVKFAKGKYLYFCDSDDMIKSTALEKLYAKAEAEKADMVFFNSDVIFSNEELQNNNKSYLTYYERKNDYKGILRGKELMKAMLDNKEYLQSPCLNIVNNEFFKNNELWFPTGIIHEDNLYMFKAMFNADKVSYMPDKLYIRRIRQDSTVTRRKTFAHVYGYFYCALEILNFLKHNTIFQADIILIENILNIIKLNAYNIFKKLPAEEQNIVTVLSVYEQIQFKNLVLNYKPAPNNKEITERNNIKNVVSDKKEDNKQEKQLQTNFAKVQKDLVKTQNELKKYKKQLEDVKSGYSFRIGRVITFMPRKIRGGIKCYKEHGIKYTVKRIGEKLGL